MKKEIKNICVYGVGGVGGYFGARMIESNVNKNYKISFIARGEHLKEIKNNGLNLKTSSKGIRVFPDFIAENVKELEEIDLIILTVKGYDLQVIANNLKEKIKEDTLILPLLNGADIYERIRTEIKNGIILPACVYVSANIEKPGVVSLNGGEGKIIFGKDPEHPQFYPKSLIKCFNDLGINFQYEENSFKEIWTKYVFICAYGLITASTGRTMGEVLEDKELVRDLACIMEEIKQIATKKNIILDEGIVEKSINKAKNFPYDAKTSYQRDVENHNLKNEGDLFGETIIRMGKQYNVETKATEKYYTK